MPLAYETIRAALDAQPLFEAKQLKRQIVFVEVARRSRRRLRHAGVVFRCLLAFIKLQRITIIAGPVGNDCGICQKAGIVRIILY